MTRKSERSHKSQMSVTNQALSNEQLRKLVVNITSRTSVEAFVRRMMKLHDALKAGRAGEVERIAGESKNESYRRLTAMISAAVKKERINVALNIVFYAALYAYEDSEDHVREFMRYLGRLKSNGE